MFAAIYLSEKNIYNQFIYLFNIKVLGSTEGGLLEILAVNFYFEKYFFFKQLQNFILKFNKLGLKTIIFYKTEIKHKKCCKKQAENISLKNDVKI